MTIEERNKLLEKVKKWNEEKKDDAAKRKYLNIAANEKSPPIDDYCTFEAWFADWCAWHRTVREIRLNTER